MPYPYRLEHYAETHGVVLDEIIPDLVQRESISDVARKLGVHRNAILHWLKTNGYEIERTVKVVKKDSASQ